MERQILGLRPSPTWEGGGRGRSGELRWMRELNKERMEWNHSNS